jgi:ribosome-associated translation inhibitor RaiA
MSDARPPATVESSLRLEAGIAADERAAIVADWGRLDSRLRSFPEGTVELVLSVKERDTPSQRAVLEARIDGYPTMVATSTLADLRTALDDLRDDAIRQITDAKNRSEPRNNRALREPTT